MAEETVRRRTGKVKQFLREAIERGYCESNPFEKLPSTSRGNDANQFFVTHDMIESCIDHAPCTDWRTIIALCRYGGMRCPSEVLTLRWGDVDLPAGKMMIDAPKTGLRVCPVFIELRPYLEDAWDAAPDGAEFVVTRYRSAGQNLRTTFKKVIARAGLVPWPRLFQNLRASRETELMARHAPIEVVTWMGNSVPVAMKHYAMPTDEAFRKAADLDGGHTGGHISGHAGDITTRQRQKKKAAFPQEASLLSVGDDSCESSLVGVEGLEPPTPSV